MKIAVITRHGVTNYGSLLQAVAMQTVIENMGHSCDIIDYIRDEETYIEYEKTILKKNTTWNKNSILRVIYFVLRQPWSIKAGRKFEKQREYYLNLTRRYSTVDDLKKELPKADIYMTGSDQVWGPVCTGIYDKAYCLSFVPDDMRKVSYAASFGNTEKADIPGDYYRKWLKRYDVISVRENSAVELLYHLGINSVRVLDPTLLITKEGWAEFLQPIPAGRFVLIYQIHSDKMLNRYARAVAKKKGLPLYRISVSFHQIVRGGRFVWNPLVGKFLSYIKSTECLITDSFHGTAFAINFNTPFVEVLPNNNTSTRNIDILKLVGLSDRILVDEKDTDLADRRIDFSYANRMLIEKREESLKILKNMLEER